jgi:hypothetical protein
VRQRAGPGTLPGAARGTGAAPDAHACAPAAARRAPPQVKRLAHHAGPVQHLSFDADAEYIASCCGDSYVTVRGFGGGGRGRRGAKRGRRGAGGRVHRQLLRRQLRHGAGRGGGGGGRFRGPLSKQREAGAAAQAPAGTGRRRCLIPANLSPHRPQVANLYTDETSKYTFKRPITVGGWGDEAAGPKRVHEQRRRGASPRFSPPPPPPVGRGAGPALRRAQDARDGDRRRAGARQAQLAGGGQGRGRGPRARGPREVAVGDVGRCGGSLRLGHSHPAAPVSAAPCPASPASQGWLGRSDHVLHQGEGSIQAVAWQGLTLAWANELGVKVGGRAGSQPTAEPLQCRGRGRGNSRGRVQRRPATSQLGRRPLLMH